MTHARTEKDWLALFDTVIDGTVAPDAFAQLEAALLDDAPLRTLFARYTNLHASTRRYAADATTKPDGEALRTVGISPTPQPTPEKTYPIYRKGYEPKPTRIHPAHYAIFGVAAALLAACGVAVYLLAFNTPSTPDPTPSQPGPPVATLIQNTGNLITPHGYPAEGDDFPAGEYTLSGGGGAEFMLTNAVNVKLRGDTRMSMHNDMNVALSLGSARFVVPPAATGFTVHLPGGARVVDLGTAFTVRVDEQGVPMVYVAEGKVEIRRGENLIASLGENEGGVIEQAGATRELTDRERLAIGARPLGGVVVSADAVTYDDGLQEGYWGSQAVNIINEVGLAAPLTEANHATVTHERVYRHPEQLFAHFRTLTFTFNDPIELDQILIWNYSNLQSPEQDDLGIDTFDIEADTGSGFVQVGSADIDPRSEPHVAQIVTFKRTADIRTLRLVNITKAQAGRVPGANVAEIHFRLSPDTSASSAPATSSSPDVENRNENR